MTFKNRSLFLLNRIKAAKLLGSSLKSFLTLTFYCFLYSNHTSLFFFYTPSISALLWCFCKAFSCFSISQSWKLLVTAHKLNLLCSNFNQKHISPITHPDWICSLRPPCTLWQMFPSFFHTKHLQWYELPDCSYAKNKPQRCPADIRSAKSLPESQNISF